MNVLRKQNAQKGFTIIEVVLVLAIAGLIFLMVFIALPALQASQRDTARKNDASAVAASVTSFTGNNRGAFPSTLQLTGSATGSPDATGKFAGYINSVSNNTTTVTVKTLASGATTQAVVQGNMIVVQKAKCGATGSSSGGTATQTVAAGTSRQFVVVTYLEAGSGTSYCQES